MQPRHIVAGAAIHLIVSLTALGALRVYQQGYNTTHREQLRMAALTVTQEHAQLEVLGSRCTVPLGLLEEDGLWYAAYLMTGSTAHVWLRCILWFTDRT